MQTLRTFIAVELDQELKATLVAIQARLRSATPPRAVRWVQPDGIHLTLKFLGDTPLDKVEQVKAALARAAGEIPVFAITVGGVGCFPDARRPVNRRPASSNWRLPVYCRHARNQHDSSPDGEAGLGRSRGPGLPLNQLLVSGRRETADLPGRCRCNDALLRSL